MFYKRRRAEGKDRVWKLSGGCVTDIGAVRKVNQDAVFFKSLADKGQYFAVGAVCDGVGGLEHGEMASGLIVEEIRKWFLEIEGWIDIAETETEILYAHLLDAAEEWNAKVRNMAAEKNIRTGTTMSLIMIIRDRYYIVQVGDSRIYQYRQFLEQLTVDATVSRMKNGKMKGYLTNYMGKEDKLWFSTAEGTVREGDLFLFCSDGGYHLLREEDIQEIRLHDTDGAEVSEKCGELVREMIKRGERDNISVGMIFIGECSGNNMF